MSETKGQSFNGSAMSMLSKTLLMILLSAGIPYVVAGQNTTEVYEVTGAGSFQNQRAEITGQYSYAPYNALGDGKVQFVGTLRSPLAPRSPCGPQPRTCSRGGARCGCRGSRRPHRRGPSAG